MTRERYAELTREATLYSNHVDPWWDMADTPSCTRGYRAYKQRLAELLEEERGN